MTRSETAPPPRIGIFGGTFDPIHKGHLLVAESARACLRLDRVIFIPAGRPWLKSGQPVTDPAHRLAMAKLAIESSSHFEVSSIEVERAGSTYTVDTLAELRRRVGNYAELYLILGMDSVRELGRWRKPERIFEMCAVVAVSRPGIADVSIPDFERAFPSSAGRIRVISGPMTDISATDIRARAAAGDARPLGIPGSVREYIRRHALYARDK